MQAGSVRQAAQGRIGTQDTRPEKRQKEELKNRQRLHAHFDRHFHIEKVEVKKVRQEGFFWFLLRGVLIFIALLIHDYEGLLFTFLQILFEPAGWFIIWTGLEKMLVESRKMQKEFHFYQKMKGAKILFASY
ncbi:MAG: hypothetical protein ABIJ21_01245 [Nanoarchaeota archaeon]